MTDERHRALVVDDEAAVCRLVALALRQQGFQCDCAADGAEAEQLLSEHEFDVVVTDLRMPNKHGHALAMGLLEMEKPPVIVIHTGVLEPRLARDLLGRGVDDILFKPVDFGFLAAKIKALVERKASQLQAHLDIDDRSTSEEEALLEEDSVDGSVTLPRLHQKLSGMLRLLPMSKAAIDVYTMTNDSGWDMPQIAAAMQRDASLVTEVLRLANSALYNVSGERIGSLEKAIVRIGQKRVGELALATNALSALTPGLLPWMDVELTWRRSMAAGIALESLVEQGEHQDLLHDGLLLSAIMHPLGRVALGTLFPKHYEIMVQRCRQQGETLQDQEKQVFPITHTEAMAEVLSGWGIPADVYIPLKFSSDDFAALERLSEPTRAKAELVKLAILAGNLAAGRWEDWDLVQFPPSTMLDRLRIADITQTIEQTQEDLAKLADFRPDRLTEAAAQTEPEVQKDIVYCNLAGDGTDMLLSMLPSMGLRAKHCAAEELGELAEPMIVNCLGAEHARFSARRAKRSQVVVVCEPERFKTYTDIAHAITVPTSYSRLRAPFLAAVEGREGDQPTDAETAEQECSQPA